MMPTPPPQLARALRQMLHGLVDDLSDQAVGALATLVWDLMRESPQALAARTAPEQPEPARPAQETASADEPLPPGRGGTWGELVDLLRAHRTPPDASDARAQQSAHDTPSTPLPLALEALGDYVGARPGLASDLVAHPPDPDADPVGAALVDDQRRQLAGYGRREWRALDAAQKAAAVAAGAAKWR